MRNERKKILWLASWYPDRNDPLNGDFVQRHARAASLKNDIHVIHVAHVMKLEEPHQELHDQPGLREELIYFQSSEGIVPRVWRQFRWLSLYKKAVRAYISKYGLPSCVHVHIPWKCGIVARWIKRKYNIPYVVSEHWGIYNEFVADRFARKPRYFQQMLKRIIQSADALITPSRFLGDGINTFLVKKPFSIIQNAVDTSLFFSFRLRWKLP